MSEEDRAAASETPTEPPARIVADVVDNPANTIVDVVEGVGEEVQEVVQPNPQTNNPIDRGIDTVLSRLDELENIIKSSIPAPTLTTETEEVIENGNQEIKGMGTQKPPATIDGGGNKSKRGSRLKLLRGTRRK
jgi:hypothetical protein